jgi:hypothetical protein
MRKTYRYKNLSYPVADDEPVTFSVRFVSDGNTGDTAINIPGPHDPHISDEGTVQLGTGKDLRTGVTVSFSDLANLIPVEDEIEVDYLLNNTLIQKHKNLKSEEKRPIVILNIKFPAP